MTDTERTVDAQKINHEPTPHQPSSQVEVANGAVLEPGRMEASLHPPAQSPSTQSPSTQSPSTQSPSTQSPSTQSPSTQSPSTQSPSNPPHNPSEATPCLWYFCFSERCLQHTRTAKWLLFWMCCAVAVQGLVVNGFVNVSITTIEKRFGLKSRSSGIIVAAYDVASLLFSVPCSYLGSRPGASKSRWLGIGVLLMGLGSFVFALPHFMVAPYDGGRSPSWQLQQETAVCNVGDPPAPTCTSSSTPSLSDFQYAFILGQALHGLGALPIYTLGVAFIDESVSPRLSSYYLGIFYAMGVVGPALGYGLGGQFLQVYIDAPTVDPADLGLTPSSDRWLGCWWMGFFLSGALCVLFAVPILMIPAVISRDTDEEEQVAADGPRCPTDEDVSLSPVSPAFELTEGLREATVCLLKNVTLTTLAVAEATDGFVVAGFAAFMPKMIESQFGVSASMSAILVGAVAIPAGGGGSFLGGLFIRRMKLQCQGVLRVCCIMSCLGFVACFALFIYCPSREFAGVNIPYSNTSTNSILPDLTSSCNLNCSCRGVSYNPVCGADNVIYNSPCHAGCTESSFKDGQEVFKWCSCVGSPSVSGEDLSLQAGQAVLNTCPGACGQTLIWFLLLLLVVMFITFFNGIPSLTASLRCVRREHRALTMGLKGISFRVLGSIPSPVMFGVAIDGACVLWQRQCGEDGSCVAYDNYYMSRYILALSFAAKAVSVSLYFTSWWYYSTRVAPAQDGEKASVAKETDYGAINGSFIDGAPNKTDDGRTEGASRASAAAPQDRRAEEATAALQSAGSSREGGSRHSGGGLDNLALDLT